MVAVLARSLGFEVPDEETTPADLLDRFAANQIAPPVDPHPEETDAPVTSPTVRPTLLTLRFVALVSGVTFTSLAST